MRIWRRIWSEAAHWFNGQPPHGIMQFGGMSRAPPAPCKHAHPCSQMSSEHWNGQWWDHQDGSGMNDMGQHGFSIRNLQHDKYWRDSRARSSGQGRVTYSYSDSHWESGGFESNWMEQESDCAEHVVPLDLKFLAVLISALEKDGGFCFLCLPASDSQGQRHYGLGWSVRPSVHMSVRPHICIFVHPYIHMFVTFH